MVVMVLAFRGITDGLGNDGWMRDGHACGTRYKVATSMFFRLAVCNAGVGMDKVKSGCRAT